MIAPFAKTPEAILSIGQTFYISTVTNCEEWFPASIGVVGARSSDVHLLSLLTDLMETAELPRLIRVGRTAFPIQYSSDTKKLLI